MDTYFYNHGDNLETKNISPLNNSTLVTETAMIEYKENLFTKIKKWVKGLLGIK